MTGRLPLLPEDEPVNQEDGDGAAGGETETAHVEGAGHFVAIGSADDILAIAAKDLAAASGPV